MPHPEKVTEPYTQRFTATEMLDVAHAANAEERSVSEWVRLVVRRHLYGHCRRATGERQATDSGFQVLGDAP